MTNGITLTTQVERFLEALAADLEISDTRYEQAQESYNSLGRWLHRQASTGRQYEPQVYVQGSFGLGTVIKPITEEEDYDVDAICEFRLLNTTSLTQKKTETASGHRNSRLSPRSVYDKARERRSPLLGIELCRRRAVSYGYRSRSAQRASL